MRGLFDVVVVALVVTGCGRAVEAPQPNGGGYKLYEAATTGTSQLVAVIDTRTGSVEQTLPWGALAGNHLYSAASNTLSDIDPRTGSTLRTLRLPGYYQLPSVTASGVPGGLSQNGRWLVLVKAPATNVSQMLVVDTAHMTVVAPVDLAGSFQFDAISNDGLRLYMIEYLSRTDYRVRVYNVPAQRLETYIVVDKSDPTESMTGIRLSGVASPDGQWLYSVYARPNKSAFIHALNLSMPYAFCLELPGVGYQFNADDLQWSLALSADGSRLFATNGAKGMVAVVDTSGPTIIHTAHVDVPSRSAGLLAQDVEAKELGGGGAVVSPDGHTLVMTGKTGLVWVDTATLKARSHQITSWTVWSVGLSPDGSMVYALNDATMIAELPMANPEVLSTFGASNAQPVALLRVDSPPVP